MATKKKFDNLENVTKGFISNPTPEPEQAPEKAGEELTIMEQLENMRQELPEGYIIRKAPRTERLTLLVPVTTKNKLQKISTAEGISMNELALSAITEMIRQKEKNKK